MSEGKNEQEAVAEELAVEGLVSAAVGVDELDDAVDAAAVSAAAAAAAHLLQPLSAARTEILCPGCV